MQVITADGEEKASRALREASNTISQSSAALQLRYLQVGALAGKLLGRRFPYKNKCESKIIKLQINTVWDKMSV